MRSTLGSVALVAALALAACSDGDDAPPEGAPPESAEPGGGGGAGDDEPDEPVTTPPPAPAIPDSFEPAGGDCPLAGFFGPAWADVARGVDLLVTANDVFQPLGDVTGSDSCGAVVGDPHVVTPDGRHFDFHAVGEFVALEVPDAEIQVRLRGVTPFMSVVEAVAARVGDSVVQLGGAPSDDDWLLIDGVANDDNVIELAGGGFVIRVDEEALVVWPEAAHMMAVNGDGYTDLVVRPGLTALDTSEGLLGAIDGDPANDPAVDGEPIDLRDRESLYGVGASAWLVDDASSLFTYADGEGPETFHDPDAPSAGGPSDDDLDAARARCEDAGVTEPNALARCAYDLAVTGDDAAITSALRTQGIRPAEASDDGGVGSGVENSRWRTTYGEMVFGEIADDGSVIGEYTSRGELPSVIVGVLDEAGVLRGVWYEDRSGCGERRLGYSYWGAVEFRFDERQSTFEGGWGRCEDPGAADAGAWSGTRLGDATPRPGHGDSVSGDADETTDPTQDLALTAEQVVTPPGAVDATGRARVWVDGDSLRVLIEASLEPGDEGIDAALHLGEPGLDGPVLVNFGPGTSLEGGWEWSYEGPAPAPFVEALDSDPERLYIEIVTVAHPTGALRGGFGP